jgi:hypothetical protein
VDTLAIEQVVDATAAAVGMPIPPACRPGVIENYERMQRIAQAFLQFPLDFEVEPANTFTP